MKVFPAPGLKVRDPVTKQHIPDDGFDVSDSDIFWNRCLRDGDVTLTPPAASSAPLSTTSAAAPVESKKS